MCFVSIDNTHARDPLSVTFAARAMSYIIECRHLQSIQRAQSGQAISVLLTSTNVHCINSLRTRVFYVRFQSNFYLFIQNKSRYVPSDIAASNFDINIMISF
mgnify:CR=1 FL=1